MHSFCEQAAKVHCAFENFGKDIEVRINGFKDDVATKCQNFQSAVSCIIKEIQNHSSTVAKRVETNRALLFAVSFAYIFPPH